MSEDVAAYDGHPVVIANRVLRELSDHTIAFQPAYARLTGSIVAGLFLSQAMYWTSRVPEGRGGWFYKSQAEWQEETCLTRTEQETARKKLIALGILEEKRAGQPARLWYRVKSPKLAMLLAGQNAASSQSSLQETCNLECGEPADKSAGNLQSLIRSSENTTEITHSSFPPTPKGEAAKPQKPRAKPKVFLPDDFGISDQLVAWAARKGFTRKQMDSQIERFRNNAVMKQLKYADWNLAFQNWMENARDWGHLSGTANDHQSESDPEAYRVLPDQPRMTMAEGIAAWQDEHGTDIQVIRTGDAARRHKEATHESHR
jgi:hypothetical protein